MKCIECGKENIYLVREHGDYGHLHEIACPDCKAKFDVEKTEWLYHEYTKNPLSVETGRRAGGLTKYPRFEPHTGAWVKSKEHEKETVKRMGYHEAPHGYDPRQKSAMED